MELAIKCSNCGKLDIAEVTPDDWERFVYKGELVQNVWPDRTPEEREILIGARVGFHTCSECWDTLYAEED